jgi:hypothetical protein
MKILIIILSGVLVFMLSCTKMDDPKVYSILTNTNAFQSRSDAIAAVNGIYARLKVPSGISDAWMYYAGFQVITTDLTTDIGQSNGGTDVENMTNCLWSPSNQYLANAWQQQYKLIFDANSAIYYISQMSILTDAEKAQFTSEARFLRALGYLDITDEFGPVILMTDEDIANNISNPDYESKPMPTSVEDINKVIIADLEYAAANLPKNYSEHLIYPTTDVGRPGKGAALSLLMRLYMRDRNWQKVVDLTTQIMALNEYALYPSYAGLFKEFNVWCEENIFNAMANNVVDGVEIMNHFGPVNNPVVTDRWGWLGVSWYFYNQMQDGDDRKKMFFIDYDGTDGLKYIQPIPGQATPPEGTNYMPYAYTKKYADPEGSTTYYDGHGFPIMRYAEVLLSRAEALNELNGPNSESIDLINQVKGRSHATLLGDASGFTKETLRDAILLERGYEFFFECKRRADLIRMDKYETVTNAFLTAIGKEPTIQMPRDLYFSYPQKQVDLNPNLSNADRRP